MKKKNNPGNPEWSIQVIPSLTANAPDSLMVGWLEETMKFPFWDPAMDGLFSGINGKLVVLVCLSKRWVEFDVSYAVYICLEKNRWPEIALNSEPMVFAIYFAKKKSQQRRCAHAPGHPSRQSSINFINSVGYVCSYPSKSMDLGLCKTWFPGFKHFTFHFDVFCSLMFWWASCTVNAYIQINWAKKKPWLFRVYRGWNPTQLYRDFDKPLSGSLLTNQDSMESRAGVFRGSIIIPLWMWSNLGRHRNHIPFHSKKTIQKPSKGRKLLVGLLFFSGEEHVGEYINLVN